MVLARFRWFQMVLDRFRLFQLVPHFSEYYGNYTADPILPEIDIPTSATFQITDTKLYVPVVTLSKENDKELLEQLKSGSKRTAKWNKYRSQMTIQLQNNNLNYLIDPIFTKVNRLLILSFERTAGENNTNKRSQRFFFTLLGIKC